MEKIMEFICERCNAIYTLNKGEMPKIECICSSRKFKKYEQPN